MAPMRRIDWPSWAALLARLCFAFTFGANAFVTFFSMGEVADSFSAFGLPFPMLFAWLSGIFTTLIALAFVTGIGLRFAASVTIGFVLLVALMNGREGNPHWFGTNISRLTYCAAMLYMLAFGPGRFALGARKKQ